MTKKAYAAKREEHSSEGKGIYRKIEKHPTPNTANSNHKRRRRDMKLNKNDEQVVAALKTSKEMTLAEITEKTGLTGKKVFRSLRKLFANEMIDSNARKYRLLKEKPPASKGKEEDEPPEEDS